MGHEPVFVHRIAMETAGELIVDASTRHFFKGSLGDSQEMPVFCLLIALQDEIDSGGMGKFGGAAEAAVLDVELLGDGSDLRIDHAGIELGAGSDEDFGLRHGIGERVGGALQVGPLVFVGVGHGEKDALETRTTHVIVGREVGATEERFSVGEKKAGERPAALARERTDGGLIAGIDVGALVAVYFYW